MNNSDIISLIIILGWVISIIFNPVVNIIYLTIFWTKRKKLEVVPVWLVAMNILFLILQLIFLFLMNIDKY